MILFQYSSLYDNSISNQEEFSYKFEFMKRTFSKEQFYLTNRRSECTYLIVEKK